MAVTTYGYLAEQILSTYYKGVRSDDSSYSLKYIASMLAQEVAFMARKNAFENGNNGDITYINDTFISTFKSLAVATDNISLEKYIVLPSMPTALPNNQEIVSVSLNRKTNKTFIPMKNKDRFAQAFLPSIRGVVFYYILDAQLNIPKNYETEIIDKVLNRLLSVSRLGQDLSNDGDSISNNIQ